MLRAPYTGACGPGGWFSSGELAYLALFQPLPSLLAGRASAGTWQNVRGPPSEEDLGRRIRAGVMAACTRDRREGRASERSRQPRGPRGEGRERGTPPKGKLLAPPSSLRSAPQEKSNRTLKWRFIQLFKSYARRERTLTKDFSFQGLFTRNKAVAR